MSRGARASIHRRHHRVLPHAAVDLIRDAAPKSSHSLPHGVAAGPSVLDVVVSPAPEPHLGESNAVEHHVELPIAASVEAVTPCCFPADPKTSAHPVRGELCPLPLTDGARRAPLSLRCGEGVAVLP